MRPREPLGAVGERARGPVVGYQRWRDLLFLHWDVPPDAVRELVPPRLEVDLFEGRAWVSLTPFTMRDARVRLLPHVPTLTDFEELNLRTYVLKDGVPGLWFLSLDAASTPAVALARGFLGLPYYRARMGRTASDGAHEYRSARLQPRGRPAIFAASWTVGPPVAALPGSLDRFLADRYALYSRLADRILRVRVRHAPWALRQVTLERLEQTITHAAGVEVTDRPTLARFSEGVDVEVFAPEILD